MATAADFLASLAADRARGGAYAAPTPGTSPFTGLAFGNNLQAAMGAAPMLTGQQVQMPTTVQTPFSRLLAGAGVQGGMGGPALPQRVPGQALQQQRLAQLIASQSPGGLPQRVPQGTRATNFMQAMAQQQMSPTSMAQNAAGSMFQKRLGAAMGGGGAPPTPPTGPPFGPIGPEFGPFGPVKVPPTIPPVSTIPSELDALMAGGAKGIGENVVEDVAKKGLAQKLLGSGAGAKFMANPVGSIGLGVLGSVAGGLGAQAARSAMPNGAGEDLTAGALQGAGLAAGSLPLLMAMGPAGWGVGAALVGGSALKSYLGGKNKFDEQKSQSKLDSIVKTVGLDQEGQGNVQATYQLALAQAGNSDKGKKAALAMALQTAQQERTAQMQRQAQMAASAQQIAQMQGAFNPLAAQMGSDALSSYDLLNNAVIPQMDAKLQPFMRSVNEAGLRNARGQATALQTTAQAYPAYWAMEQAAKAQAQNSGGGADLSQLLAQAGATQ